MTTRMTTERSPTWAHELTYWGDGRMTIKELDTNTWQVRFATGLGRATVWGTNIVLMDQGVYVINTFLNGTTGHELGDEDTYPTLEAAADGLFEKLVAQEAAVRLGARGTVEPA